MAESLTALGAAVAELLKARKQTLAVAESSAGGLINAALVAVPGASAYYLGGCIVYTGASRTALLGITVEQMAGMRSASEPYAKLVAWRVREIASRIVDKGISPPSLRRSLPAIPGSPTGEGTA